MGYSGRFGAYLVMSGVTCFAAFLVAMFVAFIVIGWVGLQKGKIGVRRQGGVVSEGAMGL